MDLDLGGLWSWTIPLWGLFVLVLFLGGLIREPIQITAFAAAGPQAGGGSGSGRRNTRQK